MSECKHNEGVPRRNCVLCMTPAERAILDVMAVVENSGSSIALTDAILSLEQARAKVADHVDEGLKPEPRRIQT